VQRTIDTTGVFQLSRGLLFDPSAASLLGYVMGVEGTGADDEWRVVTLNFLSLLKRSCKRCLSSRHLNLMHVLAHVLPFTTYSDKPHFPTYHPLPHTPIRERGWGRGV
jgi:hypothetical protein